jgi:hypothetical protein
VHVEGCQTTASQEMSQLRYEKITIYFLETRCQKHIYILIYLYVSLEHGVQILIWELLYFDQRITNLTITDTMI